MHLNALNILIKVPTSALHYDLAWRAVMKIFVTSLRRYVVKGAFIKSRSPIGDFMRRIMIIILIDPYDLFISKQLFTNAHVAT